MLLPPGQLECNRPPSEEQPVTNQASAVALPHPKAGRGKEGTVGWFTGKSTHQKQVDAAIRVFDNLFEKTTKGGSVLRSSSSGNSLIPGSGI